MMAVVAFQTHNHQYHRILAPTETRWGAVVGFGVAIPISSITAELVCSRVHMLPEYRIPSMYSRTCGSCCCGSEWTAIVPSRESEEWVRAKWNIIDAHRSSVPVSQSSGLLPNCGRFHSGALVFGMA